MSYKLNPLQFPPPLFFLQRVEQCSFPNPTWKDAFPRATQLPLHQLRPKYRKLALYDRGERIHRKWDEKEQIEEREVLDSIFPDEITGCPPLSPVRSTQLPPYPVTNS